MSTQTPNQPLRTLTRTLLSVTMIAGLTFSPFVISHYDDKEPLQSYRQSWFAMLGTNFGPMVAMLKGEMPWNDDLLKSFSENLATLTTVDITYGFAPGSHTGKTRAKPEIWDNADDFKAKLADMRDAAAALREAVNSGDKKAIGEGIAKTGGTCKACHDEYKSENYLN